MAIHTTDAIVLRKRDVRETSLLVVFYTRDFGKIKGLIKGVRGPRGPLGSQVQIFTLNRIVFYDTRRSGLHTVSQCDLMDFFEAVRGDILKTGYACYFVELVDALTSDNDRGEEIYDLLLNSLELLKTKASPKRISRILEIKLLKLSGLMPRLDRCVLCGEPVNFEKGSSATTVFSYRSGGLVCGRCRGQDAGSRGISPGTAHFITHVERLPYGKAARIKVSRDVGVELEDIMKNFIAHQMDRRARSLEFLEKVRL